MTEWAQWANEWFPLTRTLYFFAICIVLALLEIQIEGKHGWAERLPVWRWNSAFVKRVVGKPITGYHVYFNMMLLLFMHLPVLHAGFSFALEAEIISFYFLTCVCWDFLWFVWNGHYGIRRFYRGQVWWYPDWFLGLPTAYYFGIALSCAAFLSPVPFVTGMEWGTRLRAWGLIFAVLLLLTLLNIVLSLPLLKRKTGNGA